VRVAMTAISSELSSNEALVTRLHSRHLTKCSALQTLARRGREHKISYTEFQNTLDTVLPFVMPSVQSTAWGLANASGESANFDYATRADLARVYAQQQAFSRFGDDLSADFRPVEFTRDADFFLVARNAARDCSIDTMFEDRLGATYQNEIKRLSP
jgi:hypothetical protein